MKKVIAISAIAGAVVLGLSACVGTQQAVEGMNHGAYFQDLPDGRVVICAWLTDAISCDWEHATSGEEQ